MRLLKRNRIIMRMKRSGKKKDYEMTDLAQYGCDSVASWGGLLELSERQASDRPIYNGTVCKMTQPCCNFGVRAASITARDERVTRRSKHFENEVASEPGRQDSVVLKYAPRSRLLGPKTGTAHRKYTRRMFHLLPGMSIQKWSRLRASDRALHLKTTVSTT
jgi:hypothetical protein